jgi:hypothetical protein
MESIKELELTSLKKREVKHLSGNATVESCFLILTCKVLKNRDKR